MNETSPGTMEPSAVARSARSFSTANKFFRSWADAAGLFAIFSVVSIALWKRYQAKNPTKSDHPTLNRRGEQYIGRTFTLEEPIVNGMGKIKVDDSIWKISGEDCGAGTKIKVIGIDGTIFKVKGAA